MAGEPIVTIVGNLTADPEIRYTQAGAAVVSFTVASAARVFDRQANEWKETGTLFMRCTAWRDMAENIAESLSKGSRVVVQGRLVQRSFETREGERRQVMELQVDEVGASLRYATAQVSRNVRSGSGNFGGGNNYAGGFEGAQGSRQATYDAPRGGQMDDPWANSGYNDSEVPF